MKRNIEKLKRRGWIEAVDIDNFNNLTLDGLMDYIDSDIAVERSAAARVLSLNGFCLDELN